MYESGFKLTSHKSQILTSQLDGKKDSFESCCEFKKKKVQALEAAGREAFLSPKLPLKLRTSDGPTHKPPPYSTGH